MAGASDHGAGAAGGHRLWVRLTHWLIAGAVIVLIVSGVTILMAHPRLYWGTGGNDLTRPLLQIPIGPNAGPGRWSPPTPFFAASGSPVTANRISEPWNQNSWARSLHFLAAWCLITGLVCYVAIGIVTGNVRRTLVPRRAELGRTEMRTP
jgi:thiosulfate reductase cytochrome b subunit